MTIDKIENELISRSLEFLPKGIRFAKDEVPPPTLKDFVSHLKKDDTVSKDSGETISYRGANRSVIEIFLLMKEYYPEYSLANLLGELSKENHKSLEWILCPDIDRVVVFEFDGDPFPESYTEESFLDAETFPYEISEFL